MNTRFTVALVASSLLGLAGCGEYSYEGRAVAAPAAIVGTSDDDVVAQQQASEESAEGSEVFVGAPADEYSDTDPSALVEFRSALDPYGAWVEDETYGTVWVPSATVVGSDFTPYVSAGHWSYVDDYVWVSDYDWGWAPFHYGRWVYVNNRGWSWIPGRTYAGAWVTWRTGYDGWGYVGWAPLAPTWYWRHGHAYGLSAVPYAPYTFCGHEHLFAPTVQQHVVVGPQVGVVAPHTRPWVPASPTVNGRSGAAPSVGGRPSGPPPKLLGMQGSIPNAAGDRGLARAQQLARPSTAMPLGARAPSLAPSRTMGAAAAYHPVGTPAYGRTIGTSQGNPAAYAPRPSYATSAPQTYPAARSFGTTSPATRSWSAPAARSFGTSSAPSYSAPAARSFSAPSAPSYSAPAARSFSAPSAPSYSAPAARSFSAPATRSFSAPVSGGSRSVARGGRR